LSTRRQFGFDAISRAPCLRRVLLAAALCLSAALWAGSSRAQTTPGAVGRVEGKDVSVENTVSAGSSVGGPAAGALVSSGSIVTVHSGHARLTLFAGGQVEICGPAKFTMLQTNGAITLALNFGRVRVQLPLDSALRVFTPTIIATPLDISGGARDVAVGLNLDDSLCVRATSGAIQLEHQFSGEKLIVPQTGEFFLNAGQLLPVAGTPGGCDCDASDVTPIPAPPASQPLQYAVAITRPEPSGQPIPTPLPAPDIAAPAAAPPDSLSVIPPPVLQKPGPDFDLQLLASASESHPVDPPKNAASAQPPTEPAPPPFMASATTAVAPLVYIAPDLRPPPDPGPDVILLIRQAQVAPDWEFSGHVNAPDFALALQHALGQGAAPPSASTQPPQAQTGKKKGGFWASLKRAFGGGSGPQVE
jgi:hypothetical protein